MRHTPPSTRSATGLGRVPSASPARRSSLLRRRLAAMAMLGGLAVLATACGDDVADSASSVPPTVPTDSSPVTDPPPTSTAPLVSTPTPSTPTPSTGAPNAATVVVTGADYRFDALPEQVVAGTRFELANSSSVELHEMVAVRLPDEEQRPLVDLVVNDLGSLFAAPPSFVLLAPPAGEQITAVGDGALTEPGRYAIVCMIPTGIDPIEYLTAAANSGDGPPQVDGGGAPHVMNGMYGEVTVVAAD